VFCRDPATLAPARVVRVVDGDTIRVLLEGVEEPVRFYGIDTAERGEPCFSEATERTSDLVGNEVLLLADARNRDRNGRLLRYVFTQDGLSIDATLVDEGLALAWRDDGAFRGPLIALEEAADTAGRGCLWSAR
jgi:micrococcal nuclease